MNEQISASIVDRARELGAEQERNRIRLFVRSIPTYDEDGLWVKTQVLSFLKSTTSSEVGDGGFATRLVPSPASPVAAVEHENAPTG